MLKPLEQFICDTCGKVVENINEGWVEWLSISDDNKGNYIDSDFRICHHTTDCQIHGKNRKKGLSDSPLREFTGEKALPYLLGFLDIGPYHNKEYTGPSAKNIREITEIIRRLTIPHYEEARQWWSEAMTDGYFGDSNEVYIYLPNSLRDMINHYMPR